MHSPASDPGMSESTQDRFHRIEELFHQACELPEAERRAKLAEWCAADKALLDEVDSLLQAFDSQVASIAPPDPWIGRQLGHYRIERLLGRGGMGAVYLASRIEGDFEQQVAIKLMGLRLTSRFHQDRFLEERQILASLQHPNIAGMIDGGLSTDGEPYLVMEYVDGVRLDQYAQENRLELRSVLSLFLQVCDAVDYAHRNLVVHRDLKPGNILVTSDGRAKLLDFGTAKLLGSGDPSKSPKTRHGLRAFTPDYASPEQILGGTVTAATDVYSLGVILYRLLTGRPPYQLRDADDEQFVKAITSHQPLQPSAAITATASGETQFEPLFNARDRCRELRGDLDAIVLKALRKEPRERYQDVAGFADDIRNYLQSRPVAARAAGWRYRTTKFVQRHRAPVIASGTLVLAVIAGLAATVWQARIARAEGLRAVRQFQNVRTLNRFLLFDFYDEVESLPGSTEVQKNLITQSLSYLDQLQRESPDDPEVQSDVIEAYAKMGNLEGNPYSNNLSDPDAAIRTLTKARDLALPLKQRRPTEERVLRTYGLVERSLGEVYFGKGSAAPAIEHLELAAAALEQVASRPNATVDDVVEVASIYGTIGDIFSGSFIGRLEADKATGYFQKQVDLNKKALIKDPNYARAHRGVAMGLMKMGTVLQDTHTPQAIRFFEASLAEIRRLSQSGQPAFQNLRLEGLLHNHLAFALTAVSRYDDAIQHAREAVRIGESFVALDPANNRALIDVANGWYHYACALDWRADKQGRKQDRAEALTDYQRSLGACRKVLNSQPENPIWNGVVLELLTRIGTLEHKSGQNEESQQVWSEARNLAIRLADPASAIEANLDKAAIFFISSSEPRELWDVRRAVSYAERLNKMSQYANPEHLFILGRAYRLDHRLQEARVNLEKAASMVPPPAQGEPKTRLRRDIEEELAQIPQNYR